MPRCGRRDATEPSGGDRARPMSGRRRIGAAGAMLALLVATAASASRDPFPSRYRPPPSGTFAIVHASALTGTGRRIDDATIVVADNRIASIAAGGPVPKGARTIDATHRWVTPGLVDAHTHLGSVSIPQGNLADGLNEMTSPNTAQVRVENDLWAQNPDLAADRAAGVTTIQVLPGSSNVVAGETVILKNVPATTIQEMKFPGAPRGLKMACGENPTAVYGGRNAEPMTRGGLMAVMRQALLDGRAAARRRRTAAAKTPDGTDPDIRTGTMADVADGLVRLNVHCYRAEDMADVLDAAAEAGVTVASFHHATEAFKIIPLLRERGPCILTWGGPDWGGFKMEAYDHTALEVPMLDAAGVCVAVTSDDVDTGQHLNVDAARALAAGRREGIALDEARAIRWITANPARALGIDGRTGTLEAGKDADLVIWNRDPFDNLSRPDEVLVDGVTVYRRGDPRFDRSTDFELGMAGRGPIR